MNTTTKKRLKITALLALTGIIIAAGVIIYLFNMPHRNVQAASADYSINAEEIVNEYLTDALIANEKYLDAEGESKILAVNGIVHEITEDYNGDKVVLLKSDKMQAGVSCTFTPETNPQAANLIVGDHITIKGVIRSGASYDEDLEMYEHVIMEKSSIQ
jgi:putative nucleic acid binding protein|tara:strand:- start:562 stop:1038 length:477 start_codon:yes stop_codon:yes gene_type:complete